MTTSGIAQTLLARFLGPYGTCTTEGASQGRAIPLSDRELLRRCAGLVRGEGKLFVGILLTMLVTALLSLPVPLLTMYVIDGASSVEERISYFHIGVACLLLVIALLAARVAGTIQRVTLEKFRYRVTFRLQRSLFGHVLKLPISYHLGHRHGYLMSRVHEDPLQVQGIMADSVLSILGDMITLTVGVIFLLSIHWVLALVSLLALPVLVILFVRLRVSLRGDFREAQERGAQVSRYLGDALSKTFTIKAYNLDGLAKRRFTRVLAARIRQRFHLLRRRLLYESIIGFLTGLVPVLILGLGAVEILQQRLSVGEFIAFNGFLAYLYRPAEGIVVALLSMQSSLSAVERVLEILGTPRESECSPSGSPGGSSAKESRFGGLEFRQIGFRYPESRDWTFRGVNCRVQPGELVAVVGPSGVGKTTLLNLIPRILEPSEGRIALGGCDSSEMRLPDLRRRVALVSLETELFGGTILDAVACADRIRNTAAIRDALRITCSDEFIDQLPLGVNTPLKSEALNLSAGQRQRLAIARAILRGPEVLILDEATSFLEANLEREVISNVRRKLGSRGVLICVSHRPSILDLADRVLELGPQRMDAGVRSLKLAEIPAVAGPQ